MEAFLYNWSSPCKRCGEMYEEQDLINGWCEHCLDEALTYESWGAYLEDEAGKTEDEVGDLERFMLGVWYGINEAGYLRSSSKEFRQLLLDEYKRLVMADRLFGGTWHFWDAIKAYWTDWAPLYDTKEKFVAFMEKREGVKK